MMHPHSLSRAGLSALLLAGSCLAPAQAQEAPASTVASLSVEVARPDSRNWPITLGTNGRLAAWQEAIIASEVSGQRVIAINADVGETVHKGDVLLELSQETILNTIRQQEASVLSAEAALEQAAANAKRARSLSSGPSGAISQQQATEYLVAERKAEADLDSAKATLASSRLDLERTKVTAIDDGTIATRSASLGAVVSSGTELFTLIRQSRIEWQAELPLRDLHRIKVGTPVRIPAPNGTSIGGEVRLISPVSSSSTGRVTVYVALVPPEGAPMPRTGTLLSGAFDLGESPAMTVPATALTLRDGFSYLFTLEADSNPPKVNRKRVDTGRRLEDRVEILDGISAQDEVVQAGGAFLNEGSVVHLVKEAAE